MEFTSEQAAIVAAPSHIKINAVAGSGKTTTLLAYAAARPRTQRGLYLAFNSTVRREAQSKFRAAGLDNVQVHTAHSLAYQHVVKNSRYSVLDAGSYKSHELVELLKLPAGQDNEEYILASHIRKMLSFFCNSDKTRVQELDYRETVWDLQASLFVAQHYNEIEHGCRRLLASMDRADIAITHDFYLKKFQLSNPQLKFDYILFDEAQDASGSMLDVFLKQPATKIMVGDAHQQIYGWRYAVNSLEKADFPTLPLTTSFRFGAPIAELATQVLGFKASLGPHAPVELSGLGSSTALKTRAVIGRTNLGLLLAAIDYISGPQGIQRLYFEGNINSYTYADEGASLYDVLSLYNGRTASIKDPLIRKMPNLNALFDYAKKTEDAALLMMIQIVEDYGNEVIDLIKELKRKQVSDGQRHLAQVYFSTVHRCKGLEYDVVQLVPDFVSREKIAKVAEEWQSAPPTAGEQARFFEEINLLYVALTRARYRVYFPDDSRPLYYFQRDQQQVCPFIGRAGTILRELPEVDDWSAAEDFRLTELFCAEALSGDMARVLNRTLASVQQRIMDLELPDKYPHPFWEGSAAVGAVGGKVE